MTPQGSQEHQCEVFCAGGMEQLFKFQIAKLAELFRSHKGLSLSRVSFLVRGNGQFFDVIKRPEKTFTVRTYDACIVWFGTNWPADLEWPADIPRPPNTAAETSQRPVGLPVSATCAGEVSNTPSPAPFPTPDALAIRRACHLRDHQWMRSLPWATWSDFLGDLIGAACVFLVPLVLYFIGALLQ